MKRGLILEKKNRHALLVGLFDKTTFSKLYVISGFRSGVNEIFPLLGCHAAYIGSYRRFGTICWSICLALEDGTDRLSRNVGNYQSGLRDFPEELLSHSAN
jgi:hypothetical protein